MTSEKIKALFPIKAQITQEIIDKSRTLNIYDCIGAKTLQSVIPPCQVRIFWGLDSGGIVHDTFKPDFQIEITTKEGVDMMGITKPQEVTFIIK